MAAAHIGFQRHRSDRPYGSFMVESIFLKLDFVLHSERRCEWVWDKPTDVQISESENRFRYSSVKMLELCFMKLWFCTIY